MCYASRRRLRKALGVMDILYHYCSVQSFLAILTSKRLWLTDATKMNDSHEGLWAESLVEAFIADQSVSMSDDDRYSFLTGYRLNRLRPFLFCLSSEPDILSQWRAYANDGTGVAIGFSSSSFPQQKHFPSTNAAAASNTGLWPVIYEPSEQQAAIRSLFDGARASSDICVAEDRKPEYQLLGALLAGLSPLLKNPAFREEKELRLVHTPMLMTDTMNKHSVIGTDYVIGQRVSNDQIVTHFEFPLPTPCIDVVKEIWIGPRSHLGVHDIELSLALNGYGKVVVKKSSATYR